MSGKIKAREVLGVSKNGPDYSWFNLLVAGFPWLTVHDHETIWEIQDDAETTVAYIRRKRYVHDYGDNVFKGLEVKKARIVGPKEQILNLLKNLGIRTPKESLGPAWQKNDEDDRQEAWYRSMDNL